MPEEKTAQGKVAAVKAWQSNKGYFLNLADDETDYYAFGMCKAKTGDGVVLTVTEGTGSFSDKLHIVKLEKASKSVQQISDIADEKMDILRESIADGKTAYFDKQNVIVEQCCLKAAAEIVAAISSHKKWDNMEEVANFTLHIKDKFVQDILGTVEDLEEPADEAGT